MKTNYEFYENESRRIADIVIAAEYWNEGNTLHSTGFAKPISSVMEPWAYGSPLRGARRPPYPLGYPRDRGKIHLVI